MDKALKNKLQNLFDVVMEEAETNEKFAKRIDKALSTEKKGGKQKTTIKLPEGTAIMKVKDISPETIEQGRKIIEKYGDVAVVRADKLEDVSKPIIFVDDDGHEVMRASVVKSSTPKKSKATITISPTRGTNRRDKAVLDPIKLTEDGDPYLREKLEKLSEKELKDIIADYGMDPSKLAMKWKDRDRLIQLIMETSARRATKGDAFRNMD